MNGVRSVKACEVQNSPTLSVLNDDPATVSVLNHDTPSAPWEPPARRAWFILSSVRFATALTVMFGCFFSNAAMFSWMPLTSLGALHPCQNVIVVFAFGSSLAPPPLDPVQAVVPRARATAFAATARWRRGRNTCGADMELLLGTAIRW